MKTLLGCLMCLVFTISQSFAISGGPFSGGGGQVSTTGTYAGVLTPTTHVACDTCDPGITSLNQLGLFTVSVPKTGLGTGTTLFFNEGDIYSGTIQATADTDSAKLTGILSANFPYIIIVTSTDSTGHTTQTPVTVSAEASGKVNAKVKNRRGSNSVRLTGTADVQFELTVNHPFDEIIYKLIGFKQSAQ
jgi:hypothetical protein